MAGLELGLAGYRKGRRRTLVGARSCYDGAARMLIGGAHGIP